MAPDIRAFASKLAADFAAAPAPAPRAALLEAPGRVHSWPLLMLRRLEGAAAPMWDFVARLARGADE